MVGIADGVTLEVEFERERETKRTVRYTERVEPDAEPAIGTLYVQKSALDKIGNPSGLVVQITGH